MKLLLSFHCRGNLVLVQVKSCKFHVDFTLKRHNPANIYCSVSTLRTLEEDVKYIQI